MLGDAATNWFGLQGFEYLDLARVWQVLLTVGLFVWLFMLWRVLRTRLRREHAANMPWLFFLAALAIPAFYAVGLIAQTGQHFTVNEFWRFWVVHLWVEDFLELFTTVMVAYMFVLLGVVREKVALTVIFLDILLYSMGVSSARCTTSTSPASRPSTWRSGPSSVPLRSSRSPS